MANKIMDAVVMSQPGPAAEVLQIQSFAIPQIQPHEVLVAVKAAGVNPIDTKIRSRGVFSDKAYPHILGLDGAGEIVQVGEAVKHWQVGDEVVYCHGGLGYEPGNYAPYHAINADLLVAKPSSISWDEAAAVPLVGITAWEALFDQAQLKRGDWVFIPGAMGGVGHVAVQLALWAGAHVIASVSNEEKAAQLKAWGVDHVILYPGLDVVDEVIKIRPQGVDVALDTLGGDVFYESVGVVRHYGRVVSLLDFTGQNLKVARNKNLQLIFELMLTPHLPNQDKILQKRLYHQVNTIKQLMGLMASSHLQVVIAGAYPLSQAVLVHQELEAGHTQGKWVLKP